MNARDIQKAFELFDQKLKEPLHLIMGGGGAMLLAYKHPSSTADIDAVL